MNPSEYISSQIKLPKFTVIITAYNRKDYIYNAIDSVLNQKINHDSYQVIVACNFDPSTFSIERDLEKLKRCEFLFLENGTIGEFLTEAVKRSKGELILFLDDDDLFSKIKLERIRNIFDEYPQLGYYHNSALVFKDQDELSKEIHNMKKETHLTFVTNQDLSEKIEKFIKKGGCFNLSSIAIKRIILVSYLSALSQIENDPDLFMFMITLQYGSLATHDTAELTYYRKSNSTSFPIDEVKDKISVKYWLFEKAYNSNLIIMKVLSDEKLRYIIMRNLLKLETILSFRSNENPKISLKLNIKFLYYVALDLDAYYFSLYLIAVISKNHFLSKILKFWWHK